MTKEEAFKLYLNKQSISMRELWDAACEWQKLDCQRLYEQIHWSEGLPGWDYVMDEDK